MRTILLASFLFVFGASDPIEAQFFHSSIGEQCDSNADCADFYSVCVDQVCRCQPGYRLVDAQCQSFLCLFDEDCQSYDPNRHCDDSGLCVCQTAYNENYNNLKCENSCDDNQDCPVNQFCHERSCKCRINYRLNNDTNFCEYYSCRKNNDCWTVDNRRLCANGECTCVDGYNEDIESMRCVSNDYLMEGQSSSSGLWFMLIFLSASAVGVAIYVKRMRAQRDGFQPIPQSV